MRIPKIHIYDPLTRGKMCDKFNKLPFKCGSLWSSDCRPCVIECINRNYPKDIFPAHNKQFLKEEMSRLDRLQYCEDFSQIVDD